ncbi:MAG: hypothetical protein AB4042_20375 [Leptolyngbyaceae cyanobacterium]
MVWHPAIHPPVLAAKSVLTVNYSCDQRDLLDIVQSVVAIALLISA